MQKSREQLSFAHESALLEPNYKGLVVVLIGFPKILNSFSLDLLCCNSQWLSGPALGGRARERLWLWVGPSREPT